MQRSLGSRRHTRSALVVAAGALAVIAVIAGLFAYTSTDQGDKFRSGGALSRVSVRLYPQVSDDRRTLTVSVKMLSEDISVRRWTVCFRQVCDTSGNKGLLRKRGEVTLRVSDLPTDNTYTLTVQADVRHGKDRTWTATGKLRTKARSNFF